MVRLMWRMSALLTLATAVSWVLNFAAVMEDGGLLTRVAVPALTVVQAFFLLAARGQVTTGARKPTDVMPGVLLANSLTLFTLLAAGLARLER